LLADAETFVNHLETGLQLAVEDYVLRDPTKLCVEITFDIPQFLDTTNPLIRLEAYTLNVYIHMWHDLEIRWPVGMWTGFTSRI
jgi:hypothetical protein